MKVSFDFDSTLSRNDIQEYAKYLIEKNIDVWICTSRASEDQQPYWLINGMKSKRGNDDLFKISDKLGIPRTNIKFMNYEVKQDYFKENPDFIFHLDDDIFEISEINRNTKVNGVFVNKEWKENCEKLLK